MIFFLFSYFPILTKKPYEVRFSNFSFSLKNTSRSKYFYFAVLKNAFAAFEHEKSGYILTEDLATIIEMLGHRLDDRAIKQAIREADQTNSGKLEFEPFACYASKFVEVEEDAEAVAKELREAFLLYDRECKTGIYIN